MKLAVYIEDGMTQFVMTPQNEWEKAMLAKLGTAHPQEMRATVRRQSFYQTAGGWTRTSSISASADDSIIVRITQPTASDIARAAGGEQTP